MAATLKIRATGVTTRGDHFGGGFAGALALHGAAAGLLLGGAYFFHTGQSWGDLGATTGSIQATMVASIPLPRRAPLNEDNVLATDAPSPAPVAPEPKTVEAPKPEALAIPEKTTKPVKVADKTTQAPPLHPQPVKVDPKKAQTGDAPGLKIAMNSAQTKIGTFSVAVTDNNFGVRYAYYIQQINQKLESQWYVGMLDTQAAGRRVYLDFQIARDGTPSQIRIQKSSGDATLDQTALSALQHVETFGPLPDGYQGSYVNVQYFFDAPAHP
jgi:protein TonB